MGRLKCSTRTNQFSLFLKCFLFIWRMLNVRILECSEMVAKLSSNENKPLKIENTHLNLLSNTLHNAHPSDSIVLIISISFFCCVERLISLLGNWFLRFCIILIHQFFFHSQERNNTRVFFFLSMFPWKLSSLFLYKISTMVVHFL